jgi:hypothetical protein
VARDRRRVRILDWPAGRTFTRAHPHMFGSTEFDSRPAGVADARFSPLEVAAQLVPALYGGVDDRTASAETIFHLLPAGNRPRRIRRSAYATWQWSTVHPTRDLRLAALDATYQDAAALVDGAAPTYSDTRDGAARLLAAQPDIDGLVWASRQLHDQPSRVTVDLASTDVSLVLFEPTASRAAGVHRDELDSTDPAVLFVSAAGLMRLMRVGTELDVTVVVA